MASAAVIGSVDGEPQYDYSEFFAAADHLQGRVAARPALTFAYDVATAEDQPDYRLALVFDAANDLGSKEVCNGVSRFKPGQPGLFKAYAVCCRNNLAMSETTAWAAASSPQAREWRNCSASCSWLCGPIRTRSGLRSVTAIGVRTTVPPRRAEGAWASRPI